MDNITHAATLGGGCFWCLEAVFNDLEGVIKVVSGYSGGHVNNPDYQAVCSGNTGHAEVVQVRYDSASITFREILEVFFSIHDPTTLNRQGNDIGTQYRSAIFYHSDNQKKAAKDFIAELENEGIWEDPIVTEVVEFKEFFPAEDYHQGYYESNPNQGYCQMVISPKVTKFRKKFVDRLKPSIA